jgi:hypothetical protein
MSKAALPIARGRPETYRGVMMVELLGGLVLGGQVVEPVEQPLYLSPGGKTTLASLLDLAEQHDTDDLIGVGQCVDRFSPDLADRHCQRERLRDQPDVGLMDEERRTDAGLDDARNDDVQGQVGRIEEVGLGTPRIGELDELETGDVVAFDERSRRLLDLLDQLAGEVLVELPQTLLVVPLGLLFTAEELLGQTDLTGLLIGFLSQGVSFCLDCHLYRSLAEPRCQCNWMLAQRNLLVYIILLGNCPPITPEWTDQSLNF